MISAMNGKKERGLRKVNLFQAVKVGCWAKRDATSYFHLRAQMVWVLGSLPRLD